LKPIIKIVNHENFISGKWNTDVFGILMFLQ